MRTLRATLVVAGVAAAAYGAYLWLDLGWSNTRATALWLVGGVVLHDGLFAPVVLLVSLVAVRLGQRHRNRLAPLVAGLVVLVPVTLLAIPELGRLGARADRPTLLDRNYWLGWSLLATLVVVGVVVGTVRDVVIAGRRQARPADVVEGGDDGPGDGGR
jgi:hypothetical protein